MGELARDVRYGLRTFRRAPVLAAVAIGTLGLAIGVATAIVALAEALFLEPISGIEASAVVDVTRFRGARAEGEPLVSYVQYAHLRDGTRTLRGLAAHYSTSPLMFEGVDGTAEISGAVVSANYFQLLGVRPAVGRFFSDAEAGPGSQRAVAVVSHEFWQRQLGGGRSPIGRTIALNGIRFEVIGVAPAAFHGVQHGTWNDVWLPLSMLSVGYRWCDDALAADCTVLRMFGRLAPGTSSAEAEIELALLSRTQDSLARAGDSRVAVRPMRGQPYGGAREDTGRSIARLLGVAGLLLLIACANLAGMLLSHGAARSREIAIRMAIGAARRRISRQLLTEGLILASAGGLAGIVVAVWVEQLLASLWTADPEGYVRHLDVRLDPLALGFALTLTLATGVAFSLLPSVLAVRVEPNTALKGDVRIGRSRFRLRDVLTAAQIALTFPALACACLLAGSVLEVRRGGGFDTEHVALLRLRPRLVGYDAATARKYEEQVLQTLETLPGVRSASLVGEFGFVWGQGGDATLRLAGATPLPDSLAPRVRFSRVAPRFFETLGITPLAGREFQAFDDDASERVAIINRALAHRFLGDAALDRSIRVGGVRMRVIGVVPDAHFRSAGEPPEPMVYGAWAQDSTQIDARVAVRVSGDPATMQPVLAHAVRTVDPAVPVTEMLPLTAQIEASFSSVRMTAVALLWAALLATVLCALGLYGSLSYSVRARRRELAIRSAVGADRFDIARVILSRTTLLVGAGLAVGALLALGATRLLAHLAYGVGVADPIVFAASTAAIGGAIVCGSWAPARAALRVDPRESLGDA